jgi:hypothetical protein
MDLVDLENFAASRACWVSPAANDNDYLWSLTTHWVRPV